MPSIGGWTLSDNFPGIAASKERRREFASNCVKLIEEYDS
jgi:GH18 family chitinase